MNPPLATWDVVVVGGGVMGCASAWLLARAGAKVVVLERSVPGAEASSAAAGILGAQSEARAPGPLTDLFLSSRSRYRSFASELTQETGVDVGYRSCGVLEVAFDASRREALANAFGWQKSCGLDIDSLDGDSLRRLEPALSSELAGGIRFREDARLDPPAFLRALHIAALRAGARFRTGAYVKRVTLEGERATGVELEDGTEISASRVVVAAGSWSTLVGGVPLPARAVRPARGQIVELDNREPVLSSVVYGPDCYLVPRDDGRVLVGSTLEFVGYRREVTARAVRDLLTAALRLVPGLENASLGRTWSNFRPYTESGLPLIGPTPIAGLILATGHHRNGILLAPITAEIVRELSLGRPAPIDLSPFIPA
jgi:glycine oxidase